MIPIDEPRCFLSNNLEVWRNDIHLQAHGVPGGAWRSPPGGSRRCVVDAGVLGVGGDATDRWSHRGELFFRVNLGPIKMGPQLPNQLEVII